MGVIAQVIIYLQSQLEKDFRISISRAVFTSAHLLALYQDDLEDAACFAGIGYVIPKHQFKDILWETATTYVGHGLGLCEHWQDEATCRKEEMQLPEYTVFSVHYSRNALTTSLAIIQEAIAIWEPNYRHKENFTLGSDAISEYSNSDHYWAGVKETLLHTMTMFPGFGRPDMILVTGESVYFERFLEFLKRTLGDFLGQVPPILFSNPIEVSSQGAAEFMHRGAAWWSDFDQNENCPWVPGNEN